MKKIWDCKTCGMKCSNKQALRWHVKFKHQNKLTEFGFDGKERFSKPRTPKIKPEIQLNLSDSFNDLTTTGILWQKYRKEPY